jgi:hypothetical protein
MAQATAAIFKIPTESPQPARDRTSRALKAAAARPRAASRVTGIETRAATRGDGEVIQLELGITVYPPRDTGGRWRAVWHEEGERQQCESVSEEKLAAKLEKVRQRLAAGAANMTRPSADLIAWYLDPDRLPVADRWSRKHADTQRRPCQRYATPSPPIRARASSPPSRSTRAMSWWSGNRSAFLLPGPLRTAHGVAGANPNGSAVERVDRHG